jgi:short subunit dehydrogenase-like uncharacterized protein
VNAVLHCAGPYIYTFKPMLVGCLKRGVHYLDFTGEVPVLEGIASCDAEARAKSIMLLPSVGFDIVPTDCLALHLKVRLPAATHLALAFQSSGPAGIPPGTARTLTETLQDGIRVRRNGKIALAENQAESRMIDFGKGPRKATLLTWGDIFCAYWSTGIPNIKDYVAMPASLEMLLRMVTPIRSVFRYGAAKKVVNTMLQAQTGSTAEQRAESRTFVWGEARDGQGRKVVARITGPEAGMDWTVCAGLAAMEKVLAGQTKPGFQTPALAYGADFVMGVEGVTREDVE